eukprot:TRINITY_DN43567_c0_g1_i1.p2 TRINITY_DN43567_c0_g1~~TRINITY_DN43567_c0_g1_i1.p2  ORF type:complete len:196 (+),score=68.08 TRINITY_DN43567_c0_g1_i1:202-789(+)
MGCCFGKQNEKDRDEPLLEREKPASSAEKSNDDMATPSDDAKKAGSAKADSSPPPSLTPAGRTSPKKTDSVKKSGKAPPNDKAPSRTAKANGSSADLGNQSVDKLEKSGSINKKSPTEVVVKNDIPSVDNALKVKGRGGELPEAPAGTTNLKLHGKSSQVNTAGMSGATATRLKRSNDCIDSCRPEYDLSSGKIA